MINVTLGEAKTQTEKPFPKLMTDGEGWIVLATGIGEGEDWEVIRISGFGDNNYTYTKAFNLFNGPRKFSDYNEPITLQNA